VDTADAERIASDLPVEVLENSHARQAVRFSDGTLMVAFYEAGELKSKGRTIASASSPCLLMSGKAGTWVANPAFSKEPTKVNLALGGKGSMEVMLPAKGLSVRCDTK